MKNLLKNNNLEALNNSTAEEPGAYIDYAFGS